MLDAIADLVTRLIVDDPLVIVAIVAAVFALRFARTVLALVRGAGQRDPQRLFDNAQRAAIHGRAGGRCEHKHPLWRRCGRPSQQADHIYPWSKGGATAMSNAQSLCQPHNGRKSGHIPSWTYMHRLERRRRAYFTVDRDRFVVWPMGRATNDTTTDIGPTVPVDPVARRRGSSDRPSRRRRGAEAGVAPSHYVEDRRRP